MLCILLLYIVYVTNKFDLKDKSTECAVVAGVILGLFVAFYLFFGLQLLFFERRLIM